MTREQIPAAVEEELGKIEHTTKSLLYGNTEPLTEECVCLLQYLTWLHLVRHHEQGDEGASLAGVGELKEHARTS